MACSKLVTIATYVVKQAWCNEIMPAVYNGITLEVHWNLCTFEKLQFFTINHSSLYFLPDKNCSFSILFHVLFYCIQITVKCIVKPFIPPNLGARTKCLEHSGSTLENGKYLQCATPGQHDRHACCAYFVLWAYMKIHESKTRAMIHEYVKRVWVWKKNINRGL